MRVTSGSADQWFYFVAVSEANLRTRLTGLASWTVYRSRDGGAATVYSVPIITELSAANMPGVYKFLVSEDTTLGASHDEEAYMVDIHHAGMQTVTREIELFRPKFTEGQTVTAAGGQANVNVTAMANDVIGAAAIAANAIDAGAIATGAITSAKFAADAITSTVLAANAVAEIADGVWDEALAGHTTNGSAGGTLGGLSAEITNHIDTNISALVWNAQTSSFGTAGSYGEFIEDLLSVLPSLIWDEPPSLHTSADTFGLEVQSHATSAELASTESDIIAAISNVDSDLAVVSANVVSALVRLEALAGDGWIVGSGSTTTQVRTSSTRATGFYDGLLLAVISEAHGVCARKITSYSSVNGAFNLESALPFTADADDLVFVISDVGPTVNEMIGGGISTFDVGAEAVDVSGASVVQVAGEVWDVTLASHLGAGSTGLALSNIASSEAAIIAAINSTEVDIIAAVNSTESDIIAAVNATEADIIAAVNSTETDIIAAIIATESDVIAAVNASEADIVAAIAGVDESVWATVLDGDSAGTLLAAIFSILINNADVVLNVDDTRTVTIYNDAGTTPIYRVLVSADGRVRTRQSV